jgi:hypothetical protein
MQVRKLLEEIGVDETTCASEVCGIVLFMPYPNILTRNPGIGSMFFRDSTLMFPSILLPINTSRALSRDEFSLVEYGLHVATPTRLAAL